MTTYQTTKMEIDNKFFEDYPVINKDEDHPNMYAENIKYIDTILLHNSFLEALGADFDGDTVSIRSVYTQEANLECEEIINSPKYFLDMNGKNLKVLRNEAILTLFSLTREVD